MGLAANGGGPRSRYTIAFAKPTLSGRPRGGADSSFRESIKRRRPLNNRKSIRFGFTLDLAADPANQPRLQHLAAMNRWRNVAAHHGIIPASVPLSLPSLQTWRNACDGLATSLDAILYNELPKLLRRAPW